MSRHHEALYQIERKRRQDIFNQRVRETTRSYLDRYRGVLDDVQSQGLGEYVEAEYSAIERELSHLARLLESDPAAARDMSIELGRRVHAERAQALGASLDAVGKMSPEDAAKHLVEVTRELDSAVVDESCRREVVQAVYRALEDAGFVTEKPRLVREGSANEVVILGRRPAGAQALFKVELSGKLNYKFDHYQGSACKKDIDTVLPRLQSIYGIQLSTERVLWENPDDKDSDAKPQPGMTREK